MLTPMPASISHGYGDVVIAPWNEPRILTEILDRHDGEFAALVDGVADDGARCVTNNHFSSDFFALSPNNTGISGLSTQTLNDEELKRLANLGNNGTREVTDKVMTHCVPNERVVIA